MLTEHLFAASGSMGDTVRWGFTSANGAGFSGGPFERLNLGVHVGDDPQAVAANRALVADGLGLRSAQHLVFVNQVHGADVATLHGLPDRDAVLTADAVVTAVPGLALAVLVADCVPVLLADPVAGVVGVAHAGRPGFLSGVIGNAVAAMSELGAELGEGRLSAVVGPSICGRCYEVPAQMRDEAAAVSASSSAVSWTGTPAIDIASGVVDQLTRHGVGVRWLPGCSRESDSLFSYRRSGATGRFAGVIVSRDETSP